MTGRRPISAPELLAWQQILVISTPDLATSTENPSHLGMRYDGQAALALREARSSPALLPPRHKVRGVPHPLVWSASPS